MNADDFGLCGDVTRGILDAHANGQVSSTTLMVNAPGTDEAVEAAHRHPALGVGLHFNLTEGRPLTEVPSLVDGSGRFLLRGDLVRRCLRRSVDPADITREFSAQLARIHDLGIVPTHVDSHQHVHMVPWILRGMVPVLAGEVSRLRVAHPPRRPRGSIPALGAVARNATMSLAARRLRRQFDGRTNDRLVSLHLLSTDREWTRSGYAEVVDRTAPSDLVEVMVHPFAPGPDLEAMYRDDPIREVRLAFARQCWREHELLVGDGDPPFGDDRYQIVSWAEA